MEPAQLWERIIAFAKSCFTEYRKIFKWGTIGGGISGVSLFFIGDAGAFLSFGSFLLKLCGTVILGIGSGAGAVLGKKWIEGKTDPEKKSPIRTIKKRRA